MNAQTTEWITEYHKSRPGLEVLQNQIDDFVTDYEEKLEEVIVWKTSLKPNRDWMLLLLAIVLKLLLFVDLFLVIVR